MNNSEFRNLLRNEQRQVGHDARPVSKPALLGSRSRASVPMTPRSIARDPAAKSFTQNVARKEDDFGGQPPSKKLKSSYAPKGTALPQGYKDRSQLRRSDGVLSGEENDKATRLKALEEMFKLQQIDEPTFERLQRAIGVGGSIESTHLVKGLDWKLLERVRRGEDTSKEAQEPKDNEDEAKVDLDQELDDMLDRDIKEVEKPKKQVQDVDSTTKSKDPPMTRNEILRKLKESRNSQNIVNDSPRPGLGEKFKKVETSTKANKEKIIETIDGRRREVLIISDKGGKTKRKVRWIDPEDTESYVEKSSRKVQQPLGMEIPAEIAARQKLLLEQQAAAEENDDIFENAGTNYDPLAGLDSASEDSSDGGRENHSKDQPAAKNHVADGASRNYFTSDGHKENFPSDSNPIAHDVNLLNAFKRAAALRQNGPEEIEKGHEGISDSEHKQKTKNEKFLEMLKQRELEDAQDIDVGFGESRFGDEDDDDVEVWAEDDESKKPKTRKRGSKKRKGDKDNVKDVLGVLEGRKKTGD